MLGKIISFIIVAILAGIALTSGCWIEYNALDSILVVQRLGGKVHIYTDTGPKPQFWGRVTHYKKSFPFNFNPKEGGQAIKVRFAEGGHGDVAGSCLVNMPLDEQHILSIQQTFGSQKAVEQSLIRPTAERSMYLSGPHMTSTESFSARRADLISLFEDQAKFGVYQTGQVNREVDDLLTGSKKWVTVSEIKKDDNGRPLRQEESALQTFGLNMYNVSVVDIDYEPTVQKQIMQQQEAVTNVQIAKAQTQQAIQDALTTAEKGKAAAAKSKWDQEVVKAQQVTQANQVKEVQEIDANRDKVVAETAATRDLNVAKLRRDAAEAYKQKVILEGEGDAKKRQLLLAADNALSARLDAYVKVQQFWSGAIKDYRGDIVPKFQLTGSTGNTGGASTLIDLLTAKTAKDLSLDLTFTQPQQRQ